MAAPARREQLLEVTAALAAEHGFAAVSIEAVAREAGISRPVVYQHFGDLPGLLTAVVERETTLALEQLAPTEITELTGGSARERLVESLGGYLQAVHDHPATWRLVLMPPEGAPKLLHKSIEHGRAALLERLTQAVRPALLPAREQPDAELTARILSAIADVYARLALADPDEYPPERLLAHARWCVEQVVR
jgi:AcrR family transcriptional regulator